MGRLEHHAQGLAKTRVGILGDPIEDQPRREPKETDHEDDREHDNRPETVHQLRPPALTRADQRLCEVRFQAPKDQSQRLIPCPHQGLG